MAAGCKQRCLNETRHRCWRKEYLDGYILCVYCGVSFRPEERLNLYEKYKKDLKNKKNVCYCCSLKYRTRPKTDKWTNNPNMVRY